MLTTYIKPEYIYDGIDGGFKFLWDSCVWWFFHVPDFREIVIALLIDMILSAFLKYKGFTGKQITIIFSILGIISFVFAYIIT